MKKALFFFFLSPFLVLGQMVDEPVILDYYVGGVKTAQNRRQISVLGTPYRNTDYALGIVITKNRWRDSVMMRYNAYEDCFEFLKGARKPLNLTKNTDNHVVLRGITYYYEDYFERGKTKSGYLNPLNEGKTVLFTRTLKSIDAHFPENGYEQLEQPTFKDVTQYFLKKEGKVAQTLNGLSRKEIFAVLWDKYSELRRYARKNKLHMRSEDQVIQVLQYYDSIRSEDTIPKEK